MDIAAWVAQVLAALVFGAHGYTLLFRPDQARKQYPWAVDVPETLKRFIGTAGARGPAGLTARAPTGTLPGWTPPPAPGPAPWWAPPASFPPPRPEGRNAVSILVFG